MKHTLLLSLLVISSLLVHGQENMISFGGGYAFANIEDSDVKTTGWRINLSYEFNAFEGKMSNGAVVGYIATQASEGSGISQADYKLNTWPIYYAPKYLFGGGSFKGFLKGAIGLHISNYSKTAIINIEDNNVGFYGGLGLGAMQTFNKIFIAVEYEWAFASNTQYRNGFMNSAMLGIGIKF